MSGIDEILAAHRFPGFFIKNHKTEQRQLEDQSAKDILKECKHLEERDGIGFMTGVAPGINGEVVKEVWESEYKDPRRNSITERYDDRMERINEASEKLNL